MTNARIRKDEKLFLDRHGIPERCVADMRHRAEWASCAEFMHPLRCYVAWGFRHCALGHRLSTAKGKCLQCEPQSIGFMRGYWTEGYVYLLASETEQLVKIGWSADLEKRLRELRSEKIGAVADWRLIRSHWCSQPSVLEKAVHDRLGAYREARYSMRHNIGRTASELFACSRRTAVLAWNQVTASRPAW